MAVTRIVPDLAAAEPAAALPFYRDLLGLTVVMDLGWIITLAAPHAAAPPQISIMREGGSGAPIPDLSIEVDDLDAVAARMRGAGVPFVHGPAREPWGLRRFFVRDPLGRLVNVLQHEAR